MTKSRRVPEVLWKLFQNRARTLGETLLSLIPPVTGQCYCRQCLGCCSDGDRMLFLLRKGDPSDYRKLLNNCFVVVSDNALSPPTFDYHSRYPQLERTRSSVVLEALTSPSWSLLLERVGDGLMVYLLKYSSIFIPVNIKKHNQVAGTAIVGLCWQYLKNTSQSKNQQHSLGVLDKAGSVTMNIDIQESSKSCHGDFTIDADLSRNNQENGVLSRKRSISHACRRKRKRRKLSFSDTKSSLPQEKLCSCCSLWQTLREVPTENQINKRPMLYKLERTSSVLPAKHIINSLRPNVSGANALFKDIFDVCSALQPTQCSHTSDTCAIKTTCLFHSFHKQLKVLIRKTIHCRVKILNKHVLDQNSIDVSASTVNVTSYCSKRQVESFVWAVCRSIIPRELVGNWRILRKNISKFIRLRIYEKFSLHQCMYKLKISEFPLLSGLCNSKNLLKRWIYWLFASVVVPLLQANFYVTESEHGKLQVFFYEKSVWKKLTTGCLKDDCYSLVDVRSVEQIVNSRRFGFSRVRFRPKATGIRPLANLKSSSRVADMEFNAVNDVLRDLHVALKDVQIKNPEKLGSSVFSYNEVHRHLRNFLFRAKNGSDTLPCVYMVVADVQKAYDSINQDKLLHLMKDVLVDDHLLHQSHQIIASNRHLQVILCNNLCKQFRSGAHNCSSHGIIVDQGRSRTATKYDLCFNLQQHVKNNLLYMDKRYYQQIVGIPQGSILSSLLSSFYYGHMENCKLVPFLNKVTKSEHSDKSDFMLLRFIDDFLFISTSKKLALGFHSRLERGFCEYNCNMNKEKFGLSFDFDKVKSKSNRLYVDENGNSFLPWSGLFINCKTLEVQADYTRYLDSHLRSTLTVCWQGVPGQHFRKKMCDYLRPKCHVIFYDSNINSASVVRLNIHQAFLLCAMKFHCYSCHLSDIYSFDSGAYLDIICNSLRYMYRLMKRQAYCMHGIRSILKVKRREVEWLGLTAYIEVLKRKQSLYNDLLYLLEPELELKLGNIKSPDLKFAVDKSNSSVLWKIKY